MVLHCSIKVSRVAHLFFSACLFVFSYLEAFLSSPGRIRNTQLTWKLEQSVWEEFIKRICMHYRLQGIADIFFLFTVLTVNRAILEIKHG